ncbi:hypothetical protein F1654_13380 [Alkalicaulis satelles]|uniref:Uncharacterized protein n=1 Tax=Alkalicaulis satelles TaxID=2609175 RepID=A0A5M6Z9N1_9PROT|nr:hypothetical protein [Alkalicaulis satelles]KAA5801045.1 hypothetical protein F1654_13380 [Alkalicaulis satelles]
MDRLPIDASQDALTAHIRRCLASYERFGQASFFDLFQLVEAVWRQRSGAGIDTFFAVCEELLSPLPEELVFEGRFKDRIERTDMAELRRFVRGGKRLLPHDGARLFETGRSGLAIMLSRSNGPSRGAEWGEFFLWRALQELDMSLLILGDRQNLIFQRGFGAFYGRLEEGLRWIEAQAEPYPFAIYVGNSASGFPALQFAATTTIANAITYSGGTHHPPEETRVLLMRERMNSRIPGRVLDVKPLFEGWRGAAHLYFPAPHPVDNIHARHLADIPGVSLFPVETEVHQIFPISSTQDLKSHVARLLDDPCANVQSPDGRSAKRRLHNNGTDIC